MLSATLQELTEAPQFAVRKGYVFAQY
jgi:hypothetical protein